MHSESSVSRVATNGSISHEGLDMDQQYEQDLFDLFNDALGG
jgi:hypothetical protein